MPATDTVNEELVLPLAGGVTDAGLYAQLTPAGKLAQSRLTAELKPPVEATVQVLVPLAPCWMLRLAGLHERLKSGVVVPVGVALTQAAARP